MTRRVETTPERLGLTSPTRSWEAASDYSVSITNRTFEEVAQAAGELLWEKGLL